jgi:hypothetical protein
VAPIFLALGMNKAIKKLTLIHFSSVFLIKYVLPYGMGSKNRTLEISFALRLRSAEVFPSPYYQHFTFSSRQHDPQIFGNAVWMYGEPSRMPRLWLLLVLPS